MTNDAALIGQLLCDSGLCLSTAESCTGGLIASKFTAISGASLWYAGGWVTYSNTMKTSQLLVPELLLDTYGAVSSQVAQAMCEGARKQSGTSVSLSTTGIAGPTGGTDAKPVGTVYVGCAIEEDVDVRHFLFSGTRSHIQNMAVEATLQLLIEKLT